jgi:DNA-binding Lrp family transcriptional regulator
MSRTILANVDGFTPVIDGLVEELGLMSAVVFGRVWRYCQMEDHVCRASLERIAASIGVDRATVMRHIKDLCDRGYLEDLTPDVRNRPHVYRDTGKAGLTLSLSGVAQSNTSEKGIAESKTAVAESHSTVAQSNRGVAESHLKKVFKKEIKKEEETVDGPDLQVWQRVIDQLWMRLKERGLDDEIRTAMLVRRSTR